MTTPRNGHVALASNSNPHYATYVPLVARLWRALGWEPVIILHADRWGTHVGRLVRAELDGFAVHEMPRIRPFSVGNTMRMARLAACAVVEDQDAILLMADVDMAPLHPSDYEIARLPAPPFVVRADHYGPWPTDSPSLAPGSWRFPMCYLGATVRWWRQALTGAEGASIADASDEPACVAGDVTATARRMAGGATQDLYDFDEMYASHRMLSHPDAQGVLAPVGGADFRQGSLTLRALGHDDEKPSRMYISWANPHGEPAIEDALDFHMARPGSSWIGPFVARFHPSLSEWIVPYWERALAAMEADLAAARAAFAVQDVAALPYYGSHRRALLRAVLEVHGTPYPVLELGMGDTSTPFLHDLCGALGTHLVSVDGDETWRARFAALADDLHDISPLVPEAFPIERTYWGAALVDHAPVVDRYRDLDRLRGRCHVIVIHDIGSCCWPLASLKEMFRYASADPSSPGQPPTGIVSDVIDVSGWSWAP